jgi:dihydroorotate dehydrogenase (fumarate)
MADLSTSYLGLRLSSPVVASAGPITAEPSNWPTLEAAGAGAIVLPSLFEEEIEDQPHQIDRYLSMIEQARAEVDIPVIASLNGSRLGGWIRSATLLEDAGAQALELNLYNVAADPTLPGQMLEGEQLALVELMTDELNIPISVKISPFYTSVSAFAMAVERADASGLVLFNRFYQPDLDLETMDLLLRLSLSTPEEIRLPLRWIGILREHLSMSIAASTGIHSGDDVAKVVLAGADVAMTTSALIQHGPSHIATMLAQLRDWLTDHDYSSLEAIKSLASRHAVADPEAFERANYLSNLGNYSTRFGVRG